MKNLILTVCAVLLSISLVQAQEKKENLNNSQKQEKLQVKFKDGTNPDIYVDGKKFDFRPELLDKNMIESVNVIKGEKAKKEYNAPNGVILITTKKKKKEESNKTKVIIKGKSDSIKENPLVIVDGKKYNKDILKKIQPDDIQSISVLKGEKAIKMYNAPNGAIIITRKKK